MNYTGFLTTLAGLGQCKGLVLINAGLIQDMLALISCKIPDVRSKIAHYIGNELSDQVSSGVVHLMLKTVEMEYMSKKNIITFSEKAEIFVVNSVSIIISLLKRLCNSVRMNVIVGLETLIPKYQQFASSLVVNSTESQLQKITLKINICEVIYR
jgi:hypothetical protein